MSVAIIVPMLGRPHRVAPLLDSIRVAAPDARVLFMCTPGDDEVITKIDAAGEMWRVVAKEDCGDYARKINIGVQLTTEDLLFFAADDLHFHPGWYEAAIRHLEPGVGVVGTNDLGNPRVTSGAHSTHCLVTRHYIDTMGTIDEPGKALHEGYVHEFVDDEFVGTAKMRGAWAFAPDSHVEHLHPNWSKAPMDDSYAREGERMAISRPYFDQRRPLWGG